MQKQKGIFLIFLTKIRNFNVVVMLQISNEENSKIKSENLQMKKKFELEAEKLQKWVQFTEFSLLNFE